MPGEPGGILVIAALLGALLGLAEWLARRTTLAPEWSRKLVHLGGGLVCLLFPLLLDRALTVLLLAILFGGGLWLAEHFRWLQCLCRVPRRSHGSVYYPFAIAALFRLTTGHYALYVSAVLVLTVADTAAALVGARFGRIRYRTGGVDEHKSLEGSLAFWVLAFLAVGLPLTVSAGTVTAGQAVLSAFLAATLLTAVEAVSVGGRDNLYVPLLAAFMLLKTVTKPMPELAMQSASMVLLFGLLGMLNRYGRMLRAKAVMIMGIIVYGVWSLGSIDWAVPLLAACALFAVVFSATGQVQRRTLVHRRMPLLAIPAAAVALTANLTGAFAFLFGPYLATVLTPLIWGIVIQLGDGSTTTPWRWSRRQLAGAVTAALLVPAFPALMQRAPDPGSVLLLMAGSLALVWAGIGLMQWSKQVSGDVAALASVCLAALLLAGAQQHGLMPPWRPSLWADVYQREVEILLPLKSISVKLPPTGIAPVEANIELGDGARRHKAQHALDK